MTVGVVCACLPCIRALGKHYFPDKFEKFSRPRLSDYGVISAISLSVKSLGWTGRSSRTRLTSTASTQRGSSAGHVPSKGLGNEADGVASDGQVALHSTAP